MDIETPQAQRLMEIGLLASGYGFIQEADTILTGVKSVRPASESPLIALAINRLNANDAAGAVKILKEEVHRLESPSDLAASFLGLALKQGGMNAESRSVLENVVKNGTDSRAVSMAQAILDEK